MSPAIENVARRRVYDTDQRIVGRILEIIPVGSSLRDAIELCTGDGVRLAACDATGCGANRWRPRRIVGASRGKDFNIGGEVGEQYLTGGQNEQVSDEGRVRQRTRRRSNHG